MTGVQTCAFRSNVFFRYEFYNYEIHSSGGDGDEYWPPPPTRMIGFGRDGAFFFAPQRRPWTGLETRRVSSPRYVFFSFFSFFFTHYILEYYSYIHWSCHHHHPNARRVVLRFFFHSGQPPHDKHPVALANARWIQVFFLVWFFVLYFIFFSFFHLGHAPSPSRS